MFTLIFSRLKTKENAIRLFVASLVVIAMMIPVVAYSTDYTIIAPGGSYGGYIRDEGDTVSRYDSHNMPDGWLDRDTGATFDGHNNFRGWILDNNDYDD